MLYPSHLLGRDGDPFPSARENLDSLDPKADSTQAYYHVSGLGSPETWDSPLLSSPRIPGGVSCDFHTHTPARKSYTTSSCTILLYTIVLQTVLGMGMGTNVSAHGVESCSVDGPVRFPARQGPRAPTTLPRRRKRRRRSRRSRRSL